MQIRTTKTQRIKLQMSNANKILDSENCMGE